MVIWALSFRFWNRHPIHPSPLECSWTFQNVQSWIPKEEPMGVQRSKWMCEAEALEPLSNSTTTRLRADARERSEYWPYCDEKTMLWWKDRTTLWICLECDWWADAYCKIGRKKLALFSHYYDVFSSKGSKNLALYFLPYYEVVSSFYILLSFHFIHDLGLPKGLRANVQTKNLHVFFL